MRLCDISLPTPEENLACDEVLLDRCEAGECGELLRFWASPEYFVVLGYANKARTEVNLTYCQEQAIPVLRRCTGGGTVLQGPGVLNYSLILRIDEPGPCRNTSATNRYILERHRNIFASLVLARVEWRGQSDLAVGGLKFAGNAQRRHRRFLLFHGSFLLHLDLGLLEKVLPLPSRQPDYRVNRSHSDFLINLKVPDHTIKTALSKAWNATEPLAAIPFDQITFLAHEKYALDEWNFKF
jgi:lipoate-protein ligase A